MDKAGSYGIQAAGGQVPLSLISLQKCQTKREKSVGIMCGNGVHGRAAAKGL